MALNMTKKTKIEDLRELIQKVLDLDFEQFLQQPKWGAMNYASLTHLLETRLRPLLILIMSFDLEILDESEVDLVRQRYESIGLLLNQIASFNITDADASSKHQSIIQNAPAAVRKLEQFLGTYAAPILSSQLSADKRDQEAETLKNEARQIKDDLAKSLREANSVKDEIGRVLDNVRTTAANVGVETHATIFETESKFLKSQSHWWLVATGILLIVTAGGAAYFYTNPSFALGDVTVALQIIVPKVFLLGLLVSITVWCGRNYRALAHEAAVNKHRANALSTFRTFVDSTNEPEVRNAVLLEATRAIFSQAPSGYLDKSDNSGSDNRVTEVVRSFNSATRMTS